MSISSLVRVRLVPSLFVLFSVAACTAGEDTSEDNSESTSETDRDEQPSTARDGGSRDAGSNRDGGRADAGKADGGKADAGGKSDAMAPSARPDARAPTPPEDDDDADDDADDDDSGDDDDTTPANDAGGAKVDAGAGNDAGGDEEPEPMDGDDDTAPPPAGAGEVITTAEGTKIYVDPSCENVTLPIMDRMIELVGCCIEGMNTCGVSTHKLMIPAAFASMFPHKCRGYDEASMLPSSVMVEIPEMKSCTIPK